MYLNQTALLQSKIQTLMTLEANIESKSTPQTHAVDQIEVSAISREIAILKAQLAATQSTEITQGAINQNTTNNISKFSAQG